MGDGIWAAVSGAVGQQTTLDVTANNVANATTPGYRGDVPVFREYLTRASAKGAASAMQQGTLHYSGVDSVAQNSAAGSILPTGRPLDAAIQGSGYFTVKTAAGERYTRAGAMRLTTDGTLVSRDGDPFLGTNRKPIKAPPGTADVGILPDGTVTAGGQPIAELLRVDFKNPVGLERDGGVLYRASAASGAPQTVSAPLEPSALEQSNVSAVKGMVDIINATRSFEACNNAIQAFKDADHRAATTVMGKD